MVHVPSAAAVALILGARGYALGSLSSSPQSRALQCVLEDAWPSGPGTAFLPQLPPAELQSIMRQIDPVRINATITKLVSFGTRNTLSSQTDPVRGIGAARDWIAAQMGVYASAARAGTNASVSVSGYEQPASGIPFAVNISNVVGTIQGTEEPNRVYIITGHYDSRNSNVNNFEDDAPGADDDASGVAVRCAFLQVYRID